MDLVIDLVEIEKVKAKIWEEKVEVQLIGKDWTNEIVLRCYTDNYERDNYEREATAKLKELLAAVAKVLGYLDPQGEVGLVEIECRYCDGLSDYPVVAQDLFYEARKEVEDAA